MGQQDSQSVVVKNTSVPADSMTDAMERWDMLHDGVSMLQGAEYQLQAYELPDGPEYFVPPLEWYFYPRLRVAALVTPHYPAGDLEQVLDQTWPSGYYYRNWAAFRRFLLGLQLLHNKLGVTHRDLKAANLLVREDHGGYLINDFDFVTKKRLSRVNNTRDHRSIRLRAGSRKDNAVTEKMDIFSVTQIMLKVLGIYPPDSTLENGATSPAKQVCKAVKDPKSQEATKADISGILEAQRKNVPGLSVAQLNEWVNLASKGLCQSQERLDIDQFIEEFDKTVKSATGG